jgi:hypothetical protein
MKGRHPKTFTIADITISAGICARGSRTASFRRVQPFGLHRTLDDPDIPIGGCTEHLECGLIPLAVAGRDGLLDAVELDDHNAVA